MITQRLTPHLLSFPFLDLTQEVDALLLAQCHKQLNLASGPPYHQILYAFRITRNNFRGAASILYDRLQRLKSSSSQIHDPADETIANCYLMIINTLESVGKDDAYILAESRIDNVAPTGLGGASSSALGSGSGSAASNAPPQWGIGKAKKLLKRKVVTLDVLRKEYQAELDRVEAIETGQYPFVEAGDEMDIL
jgi:DNA repair protein RAD51/nuclear pore complex protein Nup160